MNIPFEQYVKTSAIQEIQGYESLVSIYKVTTSSGLIGYKTTWNYTTIVDIGKSNGPKLSLPITYFDTKDSDGDTVKITLSDSKYISIYNGILSTFKLTK